MASALSPSQLARRMNRAFLDGHLDVLETLLDEKAEIASFLAPDEVLSGPRAIMAASRQARGASVYSVSLDTVRSLSATVAVGTGSVRYPMKDGHTIATSRAAWLWKWHDGLLLRSVHYPSEADALAHYDPDADDFDLPALLDTDDAD
jgi:hypothetical protein